MSEFKVIVKNNGPYRLEGDITIVDQDGTPFGLGGRTVVSLCRCGQSANRPFCDGTHNKIGFDSSCPARDLPPPAPKPSFPEEFRSSSPPSVQRDGVAARRRCRRRCQQETVPETVPRRCQSFVVL